MPDVQVKKLADVLGSIECYTMNIAELANELDEFVKDDGSTVELDFQTTIRLIQTVWDKIKETANECEGKELKVTLPDGLPGLLLQALLAGVGLKL